MPGLLLPLPAACVCHAQVLPKLPGKLSEDVRQKAGTDANVGGCNQLWAAEDGQCQIGCPPYEGDRQPLHLLHMTLAHVPTAQLQQYQRSLHSDAQMFRQCVPLAVGGASGKR